MRILPFLILLPAFILAGCSSGVDAEPPLIVEEYPIKGGPPVETTFFQFADSTPTERGQRVEGHQFFNQTGDCTGITADLRARCASLDGDVLVVLPFYEPPDNYFTVLTRNDEEIYHLRVGRPAMPPEIQGLWTWDGHWALETILHDWQPDGSMTFLLGQVSVDGELLNEKYGYEETFNFQLLGGQPFCFFRREGLIHIWYNGLEIPLGYEEVPHYRCCSFVTMNPYKMTDMVTFLAAAVSNGTTLKFVWSLPDFLT